MLKTCIVCGLVKVASDFYKHPAMKDGYLSKCKECQKMASKETRLARLEYYREYDRLRSNLEHRVAARKAYQATDRGKERMPMAIS